MLLGKWKPSLLRSLWWKTTGATGDSVLKYSLNILYSRKLKYINNSMLFIVKWSKMKHTCLISLDIIVHVGLHNCLTPPGLGLRFPPPPCVWEVCKSSWCVSFRYSGCLLQSKDRWMRLTAISKLSAVCECECVCVCMGLCPDGLVPHPGPLPWVLYYML